jgi:hypothetical protein
MKYSTRSVFFERLLFDAHLPHLGVHLPVAAVEQQNIDQPLIRPMTRATRRLVIE